MEDLGRRIQEIGKIARAQIGEADVCLVKRLKWLAYGAEILGRALMISVPGWGLFAGTGLLSFYLSLEAQLNHSIMHGAYVGLPGSGRMTPERYETFAVPFQSRTWRDAHRVHHANPSLLARDPDTVHPLFRVHDKTTWRPWHFLNTFVGAIFTFECWAFDYDHFLKAAGLRPKADHGEIRKFLVFVFYQYVFFAGLAALWAGPRWKQVVLGTLAANVIRNLVFTGLQTASSVGSEVSTIHSEDFGRKGNNEWYRFQIQTSKNFVIRSPLWKTLCGGLDRHIEHHLYPNLPPNRLYAVSSQIREVCRERDLSYVEIPSFLSSLRDSESYLLKLSRPK